MHGSHSEAKSARGHDVVAKEVEVDLLLELVLQRSPTLLAIQTRSPH